MKPWTVFTLCAALSLSACQTVSQSSPPNYAYEIHKVDLDFQMSPDGKSLSMALLGWGTPPNVQQTLGQYFTAHYIFESGSGELQERQLEISDYPQHLWAPDSQRLLYTSRNHSGQLNVRSRNSHVGYSFEQGACSPLNSGFSALAWSPRGQYIACARVGENAHWTIEKIESNTGKRLEKYETQVHAFDLSSPLTADRSSLKNMAWLNENEVLLSEKQDYTAHYANEEPPDLSLLAENRFIRVNLKNKTSEIIHTEVNQISQALAIAPDKKSFLYDASEKYKQTSYEGQPSYLSLFSPRDFGAEFQPSQIYRFDLESAEKISLTEGFSPQWSPDGQQIAFFKGENDLYIMNADGTGVTKLLSKSSLGNRTIHKFWWQGAAISAVLVPDLHRRFDALPGQTVQSTQIASSQGLEPEELAQVALLEINPQTGQKQRIPLALARVKADLFLGQQL